jgi:IclR family transcriptional regulator, acetate operon repressor
MQKESVMQADADLPAYPIASVDRALRLLLLVARTPSLRLSQVSRALGVAPSTAHRLLAMLSYHGFVRLELSGRRYVMGPALAAIAATPPPPDVRRLVRPVIERLAAATGETVHLSVLEGPAVRYVDAVESTQALRVGGRTNRTLPANCTAAGKALLAQLPPEQVEAILGEGPLQTATSRSISELPALQRVLARVRHNGYAINLEESEEGVASIAVPVHDHSGQVVAALSVATPVGRMRGERRRRLLGELRSAVHDVEASLRDASDEE